MKETTRAKTDEGSLGGMVVVRISIVDMSVLLCGARSRRAPRSVYRDDRMRRSISRSVSSVNLLPELRR